MGPPIVQLVTIYGAGLWVGLVFLVPTWIISVLAVTSLAGLVQAVRKWSVVLVLAFLLGFATGSSLARLGNSRCKAVWRSGSHVAMVRLADRPGSRGRTRATILTSHEGCTGALLLRTSRDSIPAGSRALIVGTYRGHGVFRAGSIRLLRGGRSYRYAVRDKIAGRIRSLFGERSPLVGALVLGGRADIERGIRRDFANAGLAHLLAISGLHVGIVAAWIMILVRGLGGRRSAWLLSAVVVWCYVALLGFPASATRAAAFLTILGLAKVRQRHPPPSAVLAVALLMVLAVDGTAVRSVGAWLSAAAVWGTQVGARALSRPRLLGASIGATLATAPITAYAFGAVAPVGIVANLVAIPLAGVAVPGVFASLLLGGPVARGTGFVLALMERWAGLAGRLPGGHLSGDPGVAFAVPWLVVLVAATLIWVKGPPWVIGRRRVLLGVTAASWLFFTVSATSDRRDRGRLAIYVLNVGQGDAIALHTPRGAWVLVDGGPRGPESDAGRRVVLPFFRRHNVHHLSSLIASHGDADHLGGIPAVLRELDPDVVLDPGQPLGTSLYSEYLAAVDEMGSDWRPAREGDVLSVDSVAFQVLHPSAAWIATHFEPNENSVVLRVTYRCFTALLSGDIGWPAESVLVNRVGEVDFLKIGHHGSAGSTAPIWLDSLRPTVAVVSVGQNRYGHPSPEVMERLRARGIALFRTDRGGTVTLRTDGRYLEVSQEERRTAMEELKCLIPPSSRSKGFSSNRSACTRWQPASLPICSTTSRSQRRSYPATSDEPA
ncbi:MAG: DNA internalization-related competence protein ComEC/Rec2 [Gemmatimonadales bacterium]